MDARLQHVLSQLQNLPSIALPTDYPRPSGAGKVIEAAQTIPLTEQTSLSLLKLSLYDESEAIDGVQTNEEETVEQERPSAFHLLLAAFAVLLYRHTGDTDLLIASSSASARDPLLLRFALGPGDPFWAVVRKVQVVEKEAEANAVPFDAVVEALTKNATTREDDRPLVRVRFFDETDVPTESFVTATSLTSDLTVVVVRPPPTTPASSRSSLAPRLALRILYNSLLFTQKRIQFIGEQIAAVLKRVAASPIAPIGSIPLLSPAQRAVLPDPCGNLDWCGWKGAITDIFDRNAKAFPDRPCVVQTPSTEGDQPRVFTYGAIRKAANVLAHYLIQGGVQREEVVMVYAHRSVDLVVAVMAILKAGATFSVIGMSTTLGNPSVFIFS